jgi:hypothetical protein
MVHGTSTVHTGARIYFDDANFAFTYHAMDPGTMLNRDDVFHPAYYTCAHRTCKAAGNQDLTLDEDGNGFTTSREGYHFKAVLFGC